jgi:predicted ATPase/signal transduction histidine kinase
VSAAHKYQVTETIRESERAIVYRARDDDGRAVVLKVPRGPREVNRLANEYRIGVELATWASVRPLALDRFQGQPALVFEEPSGVSLDRLLGAPLEPGRFLPLAIACAASLAEVHRLGVLHKDIKPENLLVDERAGTVRIGGFDVASFFPREHQPATSPILLEGTLAYMSPEQTGRMNRAMDQRSDLYSLGVVFYEMLTGGLPFTPGDPLEWLHCHIARVPRPPAEIVPDIPPVLSQLVMKLLAKAAEDRYQSAAGLVHDLERCLSDWRSRRQIDPFPLAERDRAGHLEVPRKLYGRDVERRDLLAAFDRVARAGTPELILVSGYSGIGKSSLVHELERPVIEARGIFALGKFDQYKRDIPYSTIVQAFGELIGDILMESEARVSAWRERLLQAIGAEAQLIVDLIPQLELVVGKPPPVVELEAKAARVRFATVLERFIGAFGAQDQPLVLFLDDLQWADAGSLELIERLTTSGQTKHLLLLGAYRDNEVNPAHPLVTTIDRIRQSGAVVRDIVLAPLSARDMRALVADALRSSERDAEPLANLVHAKTDGNPFFAIHFLATLAEEGLVALDVDLGVWRADLPGIEEKGFTSNVVDFMVAKVRRLPHPTRETLKIAACLGMRVDLSVLAELGERTEEDVQRDLRDAVGEDLLARIGQSYRFAHDRVQEAAYLLMPPDERARAHLRIGRLLRARTPADRVEEAIFDIVNQLNLALELIEDEEEKRAVAALDLLAGRRARGSHAYASATSYLTAGLRLLDADGFRPYELVYPMQLLLAECALLEGNHDEAIRLASAIVARARTKFEAAAAYPFKQHAQMAKGQVDECAATALECLALLGIDLPRHPSWEDVAAERARVERLLAGRPIEALLDLPEMTDPATEAALRVQSDFYSFYLVDRALSFLHVARMVALSLEHGVSDACIQCYSSYAIVLVAGFEDYAAGARFAQLAHDLGEKRRCLRYSTFAHLVSMVVDFWTAPMEGVLAEARAGLEASAQTGEMITAGYLHQYLPMILLAQGEPLARVYAEAEQRFDLTRSRDPRDNLILCQQLVRALQGRTYDLSSLSDDRFDEAAFEGQLDTRSSNINCWYAIWKMRARFFAGDYRGALAAAAMGGQLLWATYPQFSLRDFHVCEALSLTALLAEAKPEERAAWLARVAEHETKVRRWAETNPQTFHHVHALVSAELARARGENARAGELYAESAKRAHAGGFVQDEALAYELGARFWGERGSEVLADACLRQAVACHRRWGAEGKVAQLERLHPQLAPEDRQAFAPRATIVARPEQLDVISVVKASQALSREVVLDRVLASLIEVTLAQGGAERAYVVLRSAGPHPESAARGVSPTVTTSWADSLSIEAEAVLEPAGIRSTTRQGVPALSSGLLPASLIQYVWRSGNAVVLDDAGESRFAADPYIVRCRPRSVLCLPVVRQAEVIGLLYLENSVAVGAFTPERLSVLELLAAQAAISLENARLLHQERAARAAAEEANQRAALLAEASGLLAEATEVDAVLSRLARLLVPALGEWCVVHLVRDGELRPVALVHAEPAQERALGLREQRSPRGWDSPDPVARVVITGDPYLASASAGALEGGGPDQALGDTTAAAPIVVGGRVLGAISVGRAPPADHSQRGSLGPSDLELMQELGRRIALALDNAQKNEFLSIASHELNNPMSALLLSLESLANPDVGEGPEDRKRSADLVWRQGRRVARLIRDLLDVTRLERGKLALEREEIDLAALAREVVGRYEPELRRARCAVSLSSDGPVMGRWDPSRIDQVLLNLLSNAAKFGAGKPIEVHVSPWAERARLSVTDHGIGIAPVEQRRIFDRFERGSSAKRYSGLGLGLYICRRIVEAHGGWIRVESHPGQGATFIVELPRG